MLFGDRFPHPVLCAFAEILAHTIGKKVGTAFLFVWFGLFVIALTEMLLLYESLLCF